MEGKICTGCGQKTVMHHYLDHLCYNCYEDMFKAQPVKMPNPFEDEEPDFEIKSDVAQVNPDSMKLDCGFYIKDDDVHTFRLPKQYVFNPNVRVKDYEKLIEFILANFYITKDSKGFDKVSYMFKEVK